MVTLKLGSTAFSFALVLSCGRDRTRAHAPDTSVGPLWLRRPSRGVGRSLPTPRLGLPSDSGHGRQRTFTSSDAPPCRLLPERPASGAADSGSAADAVCRRLHAMARLGLAWTLSLGRLLAHVVGHGSPPRGVLWPAALGKTSLTPAHHTGIWPLVPHEFCEFPRQWGLATWVSPQVLLGYK